MKKWTPAQKSADKKYRDSGKRKKMVAFYVTAEELEFIDSAKGEQSRNAYCRALVLPKGDW